MKHTNLGHYTSGVSLIGVLSTYELWGTNILFLNDANEFTHAIDLLEKIVQAPKNSDDLASKFIDGVMGELKSLKNNDVESVFTISFSKRVDLLSQWRGYCPPNKGYCINFKFDEVLESAKSAFDIVEDFECIYDDKEKEILIRDSFNRSYKKFYAANSNPIKEKEVVHDLANELIRMAVKFKDAAFSEEEEHRIVVFLKDTEIGKVSFRDGNYAVVPYIKIPINLKSITKITIGPTTHKKVARAGIEYLVKAGKLPNDIIIEMSKAPYRV